MELIEVLICLYLLVIPGFSIWYYFWISKMIAGDLEQDYLNTDSTLK